MKLAKYHWFPMGLLLLTPSLAGAERVGFEVEGAVTQVAGNAPNGIGVPDRAVLRFAYDPDLAQEELDTCANVRNYVLPPGAGELRITIRGYTWQQNSVRFEIRIANDNLCEGSPICDSFTFSSVGSNPWLLFRMSDCIAPFDLVDEDFLRASSIAFEESTSGIAKVFDANLAISIGLEHTVAVTPAAWGLVKTLYR